MRGRNQLSSSYATISKEETTLIGKLSNQNLKSAPLLAFLISLILHVLMAPNWSIYGWIKVGHVLDSPQLHNPHIFSNGLQKYTQHAIAELLGFKIERTPRNPGKRKCYRTYLEKIKAVDQKKKKDCLGKSVHKYVKCGEAFYTNHFQKICWTCFK